jgi:hypothetical protein
MKIFVKVYGLTFFQLSYFIILFLFATALFNAHENLGLRMTTSLFAKKKRMM